jgi:hypothetical protein
LNGYRGIDNMLRIALKLADELASLEVFARTLEEGQNLSFEGKERLTATLENLIIALTHETATQIGFYAQDVEKLVKFIKFREKYAKFSDGELETIADSVLTTFQKSAITKRFDSAKAALSQISAIKKEWNKLCSGADYAKIKKAFSG